MVDYSVKVWYTNGRRKNSTRGEPFGHLTVRVASILLGFAVGDFGLTTSLTIYGFGLRGNSAYKSIGKHRFRTKKHQKVNKSSQKTMAYLFGNWRPWVQVPPLRPKRPFLTVFFSLCRNWRGREPTSRTLLCFHSLCC